MHNLKFPLLDWQKEVWNDTARFKVVAAGRRTGKSRLAANLLIFNALKADKEMCFMSRRHRDKRVTSCGICC